MNFLVLIPVLAYVALHFVKINPGPGGLRRAIVVWAVMFVGAAIIFSRLPSTLFYPKNSALQTLQSELYRLAEKPLKKGEVVLMIQGSSAVSACVKPRLLERLLREKKLPARVFLLSVPGSNHFERLELLREWFAGLPSAQVAAFREARVVLLNEILYNYDLNPLAGFVENAFGDRSIGYATAPNLIGMLETAWKKLQAQDSEETSPAALLPLIASHFLFNVFRVGTIPSVEIAKANYSNHGVAVAPAQTSKVTPPRPSRAAFDYEAAIREFRAQAVDRQRGKAPQTFSWQTIHERERLRIASDFIDTFGLFTTPHISNKQRRYERGMIEQSDTAFRFDGGNDTVLALLDDAKCWHDGVHLTPAGAEIFTRWLADRIADAWPQISGEMASDSSD